MKGLIRIALAGVFLLLGSMVSAQSITVSPDTEVKTIAEGLELVQPNDTLIIKQGTYLEHNLRVNKPVTIIGEGRPVLDGEKKGFILVITADDVTVKGLEVRNTSTSFMEDYAGILIEKTRNTVIEDNRLIDNFFGIYLAETDKAVIRNN
ncbi:MAG TPA: NosD domain-containing protein, partial [Gracilimonas sp.]|nr:NosD domain-containing protein [Gracilimonas sp.]